MIDLAALAAVILARRDVDPGVVCHNRGGWHSERDLLSWSGVESLVALLSLFGEPDVAWANVSEPGDQNASHAHQGPWALSGVFFVEGGSGDLVLEWSEGDYRVTPRPGDVVLFPSWLPHRVEPCTERRITVAFNLR